MLFRPLVLLMPAYSEIQKKIQQSADQVRRGYLEELSNYTGRDTVLYAMRDGQMIEGGDVQCFMAALNGLNGDKLDLIIHSNGGRSEAAEQIVNYLRAKYQHVRAIIPLKAMSAATMLSASCNEIIMGKQSALGPIDPQLEINGGGSMAAYAVLEDFERAIADVKANPSTAALWVPRFHGMPIGVLSMCRQVIDRSQKLVATWLQKYAGHSKADAEKIAQWLAEYDHKSHGKPIGINEATGHKMKIVALEADQKLQDLVLSVFHATFLTFQGTPCVKFAENHLGKGLYIQQQPNMMPATPGMPHPQAIRPVGPPVAPNPVPAPVPPPVPAVTAVSEKKSKKSRK